MNFSEGNTENRRGVFWWTLTVAPATQRSHRQLGLGPASVGVTDYNLINRQMVLIHQQACILPPEGARAQAHTHREKKQIQIPTSFSIPSTFYYGCCCYETFLFKLWGVPGRREGRRALTKHAGRRRSCSSVWDRCSCVRCRRNTSVCRVRSRPSSCASRWLFRPTR